MSKNNTSPSNEATTVDRSWKVLPFSLELVATIAASLSRDESDDVRAIDRAIKLLYAVSKKIEWENALLQATVDPTREYLDVPDKLNFRKGITYITGVKDEMEATRRFRNHLGFKARFNSFENYGASLEMIIEPLINMEKGSIEDSRLSDLIAGYRSRGFTKWELVEMREEFVRSWGILLSYSAKKRGISGGRARKAKK